MKNVLMLVVIGALCHTRNLFAQDDAFRSHPEDSVAYKFIKKNTGYPDSAFSNMESTIIFAKIFFNLEGSIDSVKTSNEGIFSSYVKHVVLLSNGKWSKRSKRDNVPIVIPFVFLFDEDVPTRDTKIKIKWYGEISNFLHWQSDYFIECLLSRPIIAITRKAIN